MLTQNLRQLEADGIVVRKEMSDLVLHIDKSRAKAREKGFVPFGSPGKVGRLSIWQIGFFERSIANRVEEFGNLVQVWSTYESRNAKDDTRACEC